MSDVLSKQAKTLKDLQSEVYWLHQNGKWDFDTEEETNTFLQRFFKKYIELEVAEQLEGRLKQAQQLVKQFSCYNCGSPFCGAPCDGLKKWHKELLGVLSGQPKTEESK